MPSYSIEHLRTLVAVLDEGTFDAAAARLHVTASAVSQRIKAMEEATGQVLVQRANPARATAAGESVARYAREVDLLGKDLRRELGEDGQEKATYSIAVAVNADSLATWFLPALATAHERFGAIFDVHRDDEEYTVSLLRSGTVMAAVTAAEQAVQGCTSSRRHALPGRRLPRLPLTMEPPRRPRPHPGRRLRPQGRVAARLRAHGKRP